MKKHKIGLTLCAVFIVIFNLLAQNNSNSLVKLKRLPADISKKDLIDFKMFLKLPENKNFDIIKFKNLDQLKVTHQITLKVPNAKKLQTFKETYTEYTNDKDFYWSGEAEGNDYYRVEFSVTDGYISGTIDWKDKVYVISPLSPQYHLLTAYNRSNIQSGCGSQDTSHTRLKIIDILMVYPSGLLAFYSKNQLTNCAKRFIAETNNLLKASKIKDIARLAGDEVFELPDILPYQINVDTALKETEYIKRLVGAPMVSVDILLAENGCDIVVVLTQTPYSNGAIKTDHRLTTGLRYGKIVRSNPALVGDVCAHERGYWSGGGLQRTCTNTADVINNLICPNPVYKSILSVSQDIYTRTYIGKYCFTNPTTFYENVQYGKEFVNNACSVQSQRCIIADISKFFCANNDSLIGIFNAENRSAQTLSVRVPDKLLTNPTASYFEFSFTFSPLSFGYTSPCGTTYTTNPQCVFNIPSSHNADVVYVKVKLYDRFFNLIKVFNQVFSPNYTSKQPEKIDYFFWLNRQDRLNLSQTNI